MKFTATIFSLFIISFIYIGLSIELANANDTKPIPKEVQALLKKNTCITCHNPYKRVVGPSFLSISKRKYSVQKIAELIANPQPADWPGFPPMAPIKNVPFEDVKKIANWINSLE